MGTITISLVFTFIVLAWIFDTLFDKCKDHSDKFWLSQKYPFFRPNWKNRYDPLTGKVKWWAWIVPALIDGCHLFAFLKRFAWLNAVYFAGLSELMPYYAFMLFAYAFRRIEHYVIMHGDEK